MAWARAGSRRACVTLRQARSVQLLQQHPQFGPVLPSPEKVKHVLIYSVAIGGVLVLLGLLAFLWSRTGFGSGRAFGNRIAAHTGMPKNVFHMLLVHGVAEPLDVLKALEKSTPDLAQASTELGPLLARGMGRIEARFGRQEMIDRVKPTVARLVSEFELKQSP